MKALKTPLAVQFLSDPKGREFLRTYLADSGKSSSATPRTITVRSADGSVRHLLIKPVPKAA